MRQIHSWARALVVIGFLANAAIVAAQDHPLTGTPVLPAGEDSLCGNPNAFSAISRLPPVRIVVFDPVSNSFGFVAPCASRDERTNRNQDFLDRQRLALTTQKIRLLILPYNAKRGDGDLTLEVSQGKGVEFQALFTTAPTTTPPAEIKTKSPEAESKTPPDGTPSPKTAEVLATPAGRAGRDAGAGTASILQQTDTTEAIKRSPNDLLLSQKDPAAYLLGQITEMKRLYRRGMLEPQGLLRTVRSTLQCIDESVDRVVQTVDHDFVTRSTRFSLARDITWTELTTEANERTDSLARAQVNEIKCSVPTPELVPWSSAVQRTPKTTLESLTLARAVEKLDVVLDHVANDVADLGLLLDNVGDTVRELSLVGPPKSFTAAEWSSELSDLRESMSELRDFQSEVLDDVRDTRRIVRTSVGRNGALLQGLNSPAARIQRFNFSPLRENESITFTIRRGLTVGDIRVPTRANTIELKSAPVDSLRFGLGLVTSNVKDPTFKVGPETTTTDAAGNEVKLKRLFHEDENNGRVLPGAFIHNYWGRRSPLLQPTTREKFVPTIVLGIPLAKSDTFDQLLLGLNWELVPGVEVTSGVHFAKVNRLAKGYKVGDEIPATLDTSTITFKQYRPAVFAGIVLNSDSFTKLVADRQK